MGYHIYTTDGIVLKRTAFGEANVLLHILTKDLGLIMASARSVRLDSSKLRSALQEYSFVTISSIKGKNGWKLTNAVEHTNYFFGRSEEQSKVLAQITAMIIKMIPGEAIHPEIFDVVKTGFDFLGELKGNQIKLFEILVVLRVLHQLGYVAGDDLGDLLKNPTVWSVDLLDIAGTKKEVLISIINKALKESQL